MNFTFIAILMGIFLCVWKNASLWAKRNGMSGEVLYEVLLMSGGAMRIGPAGVLEITNIDESISEEKHYYEINYTESGQVKESKRIDLIRSGKKMIRFDRRWEERIKSTIIKQCIIQKLRGAL